MLVALFQQSTGAALSPAVMIALLVAFGASALALAVSLRIARRIQAIGDDRPPTADDHLPAEKKEPKRGDNVQPK